MAIGSLARGHAPLLRHLLAAPGKISQLRLLLMQRSGLSVSMMTDDQVLDHLEQHGSALLKLGSSDCNCLLGEKMTQVLTVGPLNAGIAKLQADAALAAAQAALTERAWPPGELHNGRADAFRHCYWSCLMTKAFGAFDAMRVGDTHECCNKNPESERVMDVHNNRIGRMVGAGLRGLFTGDCKGDCLKALDAGHLILGLGGSAAPMKSPY